MLLFRGERRPVIRVWFAITALVLIASCSSSTGTPGQSPGVSSSPAVSETPVAGSPTPSPSPGVVPLSGYGSKVISPLHLEAGDYRVSWTATGSGYFSVILHGVAGLDNLLINEAPPNPSSGEAFLNVGGGDYVLEIKASTLSWTITFTLL